MPLHPDFQGSSFPATTNSGKLDFLFIVGLKHIESVIYNYAGLSCLNGSVEKSIIRILYECDQ